MEFEPSIYQKDIFNFIQQTEFLDGYWNAVVSAVAGSGKCLGIDTPILMYDGTIKKVQDIKSGDLLMGDDSSPRKVLNTNIGKGELFKIKPVKGDEWICNDVHILTHYHELKKILVDIPLNEINYPKYPNGNYRYARLQRIGVSFSEQKVNIDPYLMGLWLGNGTKNDSSPNFNISKDDVEIVNFLKNIKYNGIIPKINECQKDLYTITLITDNYKKNTNILRNEFRQAINNDNITIPKNYLINSREKRLKLLAGLLDSNGCLHDKYYEFFTKYDSLADNILFLARSLGFAAYKTHKIGEIKSIGLVGEYWRITISGNISQIPHLLSRKKTEQRKQIKSVLRTGFKTESIGFGDYYGFTLDGNGRFLLGDFTITHNTTTLIEALKLIPLNKNILFLAYNKSIAEELRNKVPKQDNIIVQTVHSFGYTTLKKYYTCEINNNKYRNIFSAIMDYNKTNNIEKIALYNFDRKHISIVNSIIKIMMKLLKNKDFNLPQFINDMLRICDLGRLHNTSIDKKISSVRALSELSDIHTINNEDHEAEVAYFMMKLGIFYKTTIDFTDMIYLPNALELNTDVFDFVMGDEAQDFSICQRLLLLKAVNPNGGRFIAVGDKKQCIYSFLGADPKSFDELKSLPHTKHLPLSLSYRCAAQIIEEVKHINPEIEPLPTNNLGIVHRDSSYKDVQDGDMVLCRNTVPIVSLCIKYLSMGKKAHIIGSDIGLSLINMIKKAERKTEEFIMQNVFNRLYKERDKMIKKIMENHDFSMAEAMEEPHVVNYDEKILAIDVIADGETNPISVVEKIQKIFKKGDKKGITLSTIHKSKGLESERVFILQPELMPSKRAVLDWEKTQEQNLIYVAYTRAKTTLGFIQDYDAYNRNDFERTEPTNIIESKYVGNLGEKMLLTLRVCDIRSVKGFNNTPSTLYDLIDEQGNMFTKWGKIGSQYLTAQEAREVAIGEEVEFYGVIKKHSEFRGTKSTTIGRISMY